MRLNARTLACRSSALAGSIAGAWRFGRRARRAGCQIVWVGAESGSQKVLDAMEEARPSNISMTAAGGCMPQGSKWPFSGSSAIPANTRADIEKTLQMVRDCQPDDIGMSVSYPLPGTPFYDRVKGELGVKQNWQDSGDLAMLYQGPDITEVDRQLHTVLHKEFRSTKTWHALPLVVKAAPESQASARSGRWW